MRKAGTFFFAGMEAGATSDTPVWCFVSLVESQCLDRANSCLTVGWAQRGDETTARFFF